MPMSLMEALGVAALIFNVVGAIVGVTIAFGKIQHSIHEQIGKLSSDIHARISANFDKTAIALESIRTQVHERSEATMSQLHRVELEVAKQAKDAAERYVRRETFHSFTNMLTQMLNTETLVKDLAQQFDVLANNIRDRQESDEDRR